MTRVQIPSVEPGISTELRSEQLEPRYNRSKALDGFLLDTSGLSCVRFTATSIFQAWSLAKTREMKDKSLLT